jgi:hypothetical protein
MTAAVASNLNPNLCKLNVQADPCHPGPLTPSSSFFTPIILSDAGATLDVRPLTEAALRTQKALV